MISNGQKWLEGKQKCGSWKVGNPLKISGTNYIFLFKMKKNSNGIQ